MQDLDEQRQQALRDVVTATMITPPLEARARVVQALARRRRRRRAVGAGAVAAAVGLAALGGLSYADRDAELAGDSPPPAADAPSVIGSASRALIPDTRAEWLTELDQVDLGLRLQRTVERPTVSRERLVELFEPDERTRVVLRSLTTASHGGYEDRLVWVVLTVDTPNVVPGPVNPRVDQAHQGGSTLWVYDAHSGRWLFEQQ
jgi:hypothetical protein